MPITLEALRDSQRQLWKQKCTLCGAEPGAADLQRRVRELERQLKELEAQLAASRS